LGLMTFRIGSVLCGAIRKPYGIRRETRRSGYVVKNMIDIGIALADAAADVVGCDRLEYGLTPPAQLGILISLLYTKYPALEAISGSLAFTVNDKKADPSTVLSQGDEVAIVPINP